MAMGGVPLVSVMEVLGHSSIETTMRYQHPTPESKRKAVEVLESVFRQRQTKEIYTDSKEINALIN